jgi:alpha-L-fucosidase
LEGNLLSLGDSASVEVGFEWRDITGLDTNDRPDTWLASALTARTAPGNFTTSLPTLESGHGYEVRAVVKHPLLTLYGRELRLRVP